MKTAITLLLIFFSSLLLAQNVDHLLLTKFSKSEIDEMKNNNLNEYYFLSYCITDGFYFVDYPKNKNIKHRISGNIFIDNIEEFNFLELEIDFLKDDYKYYKVDNKDLLLVIKSIDHIKAELKVNQDEN